MAIPGAGIEKISAMAPYFSGGDALDIEVVNSTDTGLEFNVTGCPYATFYKELGVSEFGFLPFCNLDFPLAEALGADFKRTQTIMQGADHCDFRYALKKDPAST